MFNQGNAGVLLPNGDVFEGPNNRLGIFTSDGHTVLRAQPVDGAADPSAPEVLRGIADILGKIWTLPNTVIGLATEIVLAPFAIANGGGFQLGNNSIQLVGLAFGE